MRAAVVVLLAAVTTAFAPQQPFRTSVDLVHFSVIVTDKQGAPVTGLTADDFELVEDGKPQSLTYFLEGFRRERRSRPGPAAPSRSRARHQRQHGGRHP